MSDDIELSRRSSADFILGGFVALGAGVLLHLLTRGGESSFYPVCGIVIAVVGWAMLGLGLTRLGTKVDDLYRQRVSRSRVDSQT